MLSAYIPSESGNSLTPHEETDSLVATLEKDPLGFFWGRLKSIPTWSLGPPSIPHQQQAFL